MAAMVGTARYDNQFNNSYPFGTNTINSDGSNSWVASPVGDYSYYGAAFPTATVAGTVTTAVAQVI